MLKKSLVLAVLVGFAAWPAAAQEKSLDQVLQNHYEAIGGLDAWQSLQSVKATGMRQMGMGVEAPFTMVAKRPSKLRVEFTFQGMTGIMAYDGETAWMVMPFMGKTEPEVMPDFMAQELKNESDLDGPLVGYEEDGNQVELMGLEEIEGTSAYKLKVTLKNGDVQTWYLDSEYYVPIKMVGTQEMQGREIKYEVTLGDYKEVGGLMMAHSIESKAEGSPEGFVMTLQTVELNPELDDESFSMPKSDEKGQP